RMHKDGDRAGAGQRLGDLLTDNAGLAHTDDDDFARAGRDSCHRRLDATAVKVCGALLDGASLESQKLYDLLKMILRNDLRFWFHLSISCRPRKRPSRSATCLRDSSRSGRNSRSRLSARPYSLNMYWSSRQYRRSRKKLYAC